MTKKEKREKQRHQVKSRWYYIFWGTCTVAVCAGQVLVGSGFRKMAESLESVLDSPIHIDFGVPRYRHPMMAPDKWYNPLDEDGNLYHPTDPPKAVSPEYEKDFRSRI